MGDGAGAQMSSTIPSPVLSALDRLNNHARVHGSGRKAIYAYKSLAALLLAQSGELQVRPVGLMAKCLRCDGTGRFHRGGADTGERCRSCGATGYVHLRFCETTAGAIHWHHPWITDGQRIFEEATRPAAIEYEPATRSLLLTGGDGTTRELPFESPGDWRPNRPGERLVGEDAAALLNAIEDWIESMIPDNQSQRWHVESARNEMCRYALDLGWFGDTCHYCGAERGNGGQGHYAGRLLHWAVYTCHEHAHMRLDQWDKTVPPAAALTPEVMRWLDRRGGIPQPDRQPSPAVSAGPWDDADLPF